MSAATQFQVYNSPGGPHTQGVQYVLDTVSGVFRPLYASDLGGGVGGSTDMTATNAKLDTLITYGVLDSGFQRPANKTCSVAYTGSLLAKSSNGELHSIFGYNSGAFSQFVRIHDGTSNAGAVAGVFAISPSNNFSIDFAKGMTMANGIFVALSSSPTGSVASSGDAIITVLWK